MLVLVPALVPPELAVEVNVLESLVSQTPSPPCYQSRFHETSWQIHEPIIRLDLFILNEDIIPAP